MRQIVLDTETTGLEPSEGHRIIEIGCVEILDRRVTRNSFHQYLQPDREIDAGAIAVHGLTDDFLRDKPRFADIAEELLRYLGGTELIVHNAAFDLGFIDHELQRWRPDTPRVADLCPVTDTLALARERHPGQRNSLDALCKRYNVDSSARERHGALLDAELLADVYLAMTGGQVSLLFEGARQAGTQCSRRDARLSLPAERPPLRVVKASPEELEAHRERLEAIDRASGGECVWLREGTGQALDP